MEQQGNRQSSPGNAPLAAGGPSATQKTGRPLPDQADPQEKRTRFENEPPAAATGPVGLPPPQSASSDPSQPGLKATSLTNEEEDLVKLLHDKLGTSDDKIRKVLADLQEDGSWIKKTRHVSDVLEAKTPTLTIRDLTNVFDFKHVVKSAHDLLTQVLNDSKHSRAVLFGHKSQGKTQTLHFVMKLLQGIDELVVLLDEHSITSETRLLMQYSEYYWITPLQSILEAKTKAVKESAQTLHNLAKDAKTKSHEMAAVANSVDTDVNEQRREAPGVLSTETESSYGIAEEAFKIASAAEEAFEIAAAAGTESLIKVAVETAKKVECMESILKLTGEKIATLDQTNTEINEATKPTCWATVFSNRILQYTQPQQDDSRIMHSESLEVRVSQNFHKLVLELYLLAAKLYIIGANADVTPETRNEMVEAATYVSRIAQGLPESSDEAGDIRKIAACAYQVGSDAYIDQFAGGSAINPLSRVTAVIFLKMTVKFYKALVGINGGLAAPKEMSADAYQLVSKCYQSAATTKEKEAQKLSTLFFPVTTGYSKKPLLEGLSDIVTGGGYRVWILVDNLPKWKNPGDMYQWFFPQDGKPSCFHFIVTGGDGMGQWTSTNQLEDSIVDLPFLSKKDGWELAKKLALKLDVSDDLQKQLADYGDAADHIESRFGGIPGYIIDLILKLKQDSRVVGHFSKLERDLTDLLEKRPLTPKQFAEMCLRARHTSDCWRFLRRADLCGCSSPRGTILKMIMKWLILFGEPNLAEIIAQFRPLVSKGPSLDGHLLEMLELIKMNNFEEINTCKLVLESDKWVRKEDISLLGKPGTLCSFDGESVDVREKECRWYVMRVPDCFAVADAVILEKTGKDTLNLYWVQITRSPKPFTHKTHLDCSDEAKKRLEVCRKAILLEFGFEKFASETYVMIAPNCESEEYRPSGAHKEPYLFSPLHIVKNVAKARKPKAEGQACNCKTGCINQRCSCKKESRSCTSSCKCMNCQNKNG